MTNLDRNKNDTHINLKLKKINKFAATLITVTYQPCVVWEGNLNMSILIHDVLGIPN